MKKKIKYNLIKNSLIFFLLLIIFNLFTYNYMINQKDKTYENIYQIKFNEQGMKKYLNFFDFLVNLDVKLDGDYFFIGSGQIFRTVKNNLETSDSDKNNFLNEMKDIRIDISKNIYSEVKKKKISLIKITYFNTSEKNNERLINNFSKNLEDIILKDAFVILEKNMKLIFDYHNALLKYEKKYNLKKSLSSKRFLNIYEYKKNELIRDILDTNELKISYVETKIYNFYNVKNLLLINIMFVIIAIILQIMFSLDYLKLIFNKFRKRFIP
jgi:hypothetical protein